MLKTIKIKSQEINYKIIKTKRAKRLSISVHSDLSVVATMPKWMPKIYAEKFLKEKSDWIIKKINYLSKLKDSKIIKISKTDYKEKRKEAEELVNKKVLELNKFYNFKFNKITIRNQKTRWGSCSSKGNLNFNYKLIYLSEKQIDYIIVHELCHLKEMNHSQKFWNLVAKVFPDHKEIRKDLKKEGILLA
jgi:predicted metal-dependent hydrolase